MKLKTLLQEVFVKSKDRSLEGWQIVIFLLCWFGYALVYFGRQNLSVALSAIETHYSSNQTTVALIGTLFFWVYAVGKLVNGYLGDYVNNKRQIFIGLLVSGLCNICVALAPNITVIMIIWGINGLAQSAIWCNIIGIVSHWFFPEQHTKLAVWLSTSMVLGSALAYSICGIIVKRLPWQWVFIIPGVVLVAFALLWSFLGKNKAEDLGFSPISLFPEKEAREATPSKNQVPLLKFMLTSGVLFVTVAALAQGVIKDGIGLWAPTIMENIFSLDTSTSSLVITFIPIVNFFGISSASFIQNKLKMGDQATGNILMGIGVLSLLLLRVSMNGPPILGIFWIALASASMYGINTLLLGIYPLRYASAGRASFVSGFLDFISYLTTGAFSIITGYLLDNGYSWSTVFLLWIGLILIGMIALFFVPRKKKTP